MEHIEIDWLVTLFAVHFLGLTAAIYLWRDAPCWLQRISVALLVVSFGFFCSAYIAAILKFAPWWNLLIIAGVFEHLAVLVYVFRIWWQTEEKKWKSSINSPNS
jgi:hypothetical protein